MEKGMKKDRIALGPSREETRWIQRVGNLELILRRVSVDESSHPQWTLLFRDISGNGQGEVMWVCDLEGVLRLDEAIGLMLSTVNEEEPGLLSDVLKEAQENNCKGAG